MSLTENGEPARAGSRRVRDLLRAGERRLATVGVDAPGPCAAMLLAHALGWERIALYSRSDEVAAADAAARFDEFLSRRAAREPVQYILRSTEFWSLPILCDHRALIPRPETEAVVETALAVIEGRMSPRIADIGTGTGCIAIALAHERPDARIYASDVSRDALALAARNLERHALGQRVRLLEGDLCAPFLARGLREQFDLIVCNPPYIGETEMPSLQAEVREHEPWVALCAGPEALQFIRRLLEETPALLRPDGRLVMEVAEGQADAIHELVRSNSRWLAAKCALDGAGLERVFAMCYSAKQVAT